MFLRHFQCCATNHTEAYLKPYDTQTFEYLDAYPSLRSDTGKNIYPTEVAKACSEFTLSQRILNVFNSHCTLKAIMRQAIVLGIFRFVFIHFIVLEWREGITSVNLESRK